MISFYGFHSGLCLYSANIKKMQHRLFVHVAFFLFSHSQSAFSLGFNLISL